MHVNDALTDNNYLDWVQEMENSCSPRTRLASSIEPSKGQKRAILVIWHGCDAMQ
ncbi:hypothetical protein HanXRQr2_Chr16g0753841 [Helianthus annuus]|uniref:Uncharacterized protein n=1 Tax=Helianthus annuus TaxID=4232 RepID=A0A251RZJ0_HELAN|nr:hypothetical protein HanXRQr2_Chr16g0753841 [Helianthus annuus]